MSAIVLAVLTAVTVPTTVAQAAPAETASSHSYKDFQLRSQQNDYYGFISPSRNVKCEFQPGDAGAPGAAKPVLDVRCEAKKVTWSERTGICGQFKYQNVMSQTYGQNASNLTCTMKRTLTPPDFAANWWDGYPTLDRGIKVNFIGYVCSVHGQGMKERVKCAYPSAPQRGFTYGRSVVKVSMPYSNALTYQD